MKKKIAYTTMIMSSIALMSTGFAAWVISGNDKEVGEGSIVVDTVSNESRSISGFTWVDTSDPKIVFSMPEHPDPSFDDSKLTYNDSSIGYEKLSAKATFEVINVNESEKLKDIMDIELSLNDSADTNNFSKAIENKYIAGLPSLKENEDGWSDFTTVPDENGSAEYGISVKRSSEEASSNDKTKFDIEIKFAWGGAFNYENPYYYYNKLGDEFEDSKAESQLNEMNKFLNGVSYKLTITTKSPTISEKND